MSLFGLFKSKKPKLSADVNEAGAQIAALAFPGGNKQIDEDAERLHSLLGGAIPKPLTKELLFKSKALLVIAQDKSESRILPSIQASAGDKLTAHQCNIVYQFITSSLDFPNRGNDGSTIARAVKLKATSAIAGITEEYTWLSARFGKKDHDWSIGDRWQDEIDGKTIEIFALNFKDGSTKEVHFDISSVFGSF